MTDPPMGRRTDLGLRRSGPAVHPDPAGRELARRRGHRGQRRPRPRHRRLGRVRRRRRLSRTEDVRGAAGRGRHATTPTWRCASIARSPRTARSTGIPPTSVGGQRWSPDGTISTCAATKRFLRFIAVPWRKLYRRSLLEDNLIRFPVGDHFYEDNPFHWFCLLSAGSIAVVPQVLCYHRVGRAGQTMANGDARLFTIFAHHGTIQDWLRERALFDIYSVSLLEWVISQAGVGRPADAEGASAAVVLDTPSDHRRVPARDSRPGPAGGPQG